MSVKRSSRKSQMMKPQPLLTLPPTTDNPRNSEGDFVRLRDERLLFVYTHFVGGGADHADAHLAGRISEDGGRTWDARDHTILPNDEAAMNIMSVTLRRLADGRIALFYLRKESFDDCRPCVRFSDDEARTWSDATCLIDDAHIGYYILNNDRVVRLERGGSAGRWVAPLSQHNGPTFEAYTKIACATCWLSDDDGRTWRPAADTIAPPGEGDAQVPLQEPGVVELSDGRLMMFMRTNAGCQYVAFSEDGGEHWSDAQPSAIRSPLSPASIKRIPRTGDLLLAWNDNHDPANPARGGDRTPFNVAVSSDEGRSWTHQKTIADDPAGWYCYTAIHFEDDRVLLAHVAGDAERGRLATTRITGFDLDWLYA